MVTGIFDPSGTPGQTGIRDSGGCPHDTKLPVRPEFKIPEGVSQPLLKKEDDREVRPKNPTPGHFEKTDDDREV